VVQPPSIIGARYRVLRELGRGGMGVVYLVEHAHTGDHLALKVLLAHAGASAEVVQRFKREARTPGRIRSEHVVRITDADVAPELGGAPFLVMECLEGSDLEKTLERSGPLSPEMTVWALAQVASALDRAHGMGIVHRDLKPENIFLHRRDSGEPIIKILDFGISKISGDGLGGIAQAGLTRSGVAMGTPLYMAPEQARGASSIGPATDVWALGLIAYRLLTARIYWTSQTMAELMVELLTAPMRPPSAGAGLPVRFDAWFLRSCERDPERRWRTVGEQVDALAEALGLPAPSVRGAQSSGSRAVQAAGMPGKLGDSTPRGATQLLATSATPITNTQGKPIGPRRRGAGWVVAAAAMGSLLVASWLLRSTLQGRDGAAPEEAAGGAAVATSGQAPESVHTTPPPGPAPQAEPAAAPSASAAAAPPASASAPLRVAKPIPVKNPTASGAAGPTTVPGAAGKPPAKPSAYNPAAP
jgi:serine/threonine-protein kinase